MIRKSNGNRTPLIVLLVVFCLMILLFVILNFYDDYFDLRNFYVDNQFFKQIYRKMFLRIQRNNITSYYIYIKKIIIIITLRILLLLM